MDTQPEISLVGDRVSHMRLCRFGIFRSACWRQEGVAEGSKYPSVRSLSTSDYMNTGPTIKPPSINLLKYKHQVLYLTQQPLLEREYKNVKREVSRTLSLTITPNGPIFNSSRSQHITSFAPFIWFRYCCCWFLVCVCIHRVL